VLESIRHGRAGARASAPRCADDVLPLPPRCATRGPKRSLGDASATP
jgi:hypothetical protein